MRYPMIYVLPALALVCTARPAEAQYSMHPDFGGYTYRSPYRNYSFSYRYDTRATYVRSGRFSNHYDASGAAGLMPTAPTLRPGRASIPQGATLAAPGNLQAGSTAPSKTTSLPSTGLSGGGTQPSLSKTPSLAWSTSPPSTGAPVAPGTSVSTPAYSPFQDPQWTSKRRFYRSTRR